MYETFTFESKLAEVDKLEKQWLDEKADLLFKIEKYQREKDDWLRLKKCLFEEIALLEEQLTKIENCETLTDDLLVPIPETKLTFKPTPPPVQKIQPQKLEPTDDSKADIVVNTISQPNTQNSQQSQTESSSNQAVVSTKPETNETVEVNTTANKSDLSTAPIPSSTESSNISDNTNKQVQFEASQLNESPAQQSEAQKSDSTENVSKQESIVESKSDISNKSEEEEETPEPTTAAAKKGGKKKPVKKGGKKSIKKKDGTLDPFAPQPYHYSLKTTIYQHLDAVRAIVFHSTQPLLASAGDDGSIRLVDLEHRRTVGKKIVKTIQTYGSLRGHNCSIVSLASLGNILYSGDINGVLCVWEFSAPPPGANVEVFGRADHHCLFTNTIHSDAIWSITASSLFFVTASSDGTICVFNSQNYQKLDTIEIPEKPVVVSFIYNSQTKFALGCIDGTINLFERGNEKTEKLFSISIGSRITCVSPNVGELVFGCADRKVARIKIDDENNSMEIKDTHELHAKAVTGIAVLPGGQYIATTSQDREIRGWCLEGMELKSSDKVIREKFGDAGLGVAAPPVNSTLRIFAVASADGSIKLYTT